MQYIPEHILLRLVFFFWGGGAGRKLGKNKIWWDKLNLLECLPVTQCASPSLPLCLVVVTA